MPTGFNIQITGLNKITAKFKELPTEVEKVLQEEMNAFALNTSREAKLACPNNEGALEASIQPFYHRLSTGVVVAEDYAAFVEFGSRRFAAEHVASLPADWQTFAAQFKGKGGGSFQELVARITEWVRKKGLGTGFAGKIGVTGTYSVKTRKRVGNKDTQEKQNRQAAYAIAISIIKNGIKPQPFLQPAADRNRDILEKNLAKIFGK